MAAATAASLGGGNTALIRQGKDVLGFSWNLCGGGFKMVNSGKREKKTRAMVAATAKASSVGALSGLKHQKLIPTVGNQEKLIPTVGNQEKLIPTVGNQDLPSVSPEKLDEWTRKSISEIMRNIKQAPFLVQVYSNDGSYVDDSTPSSSTSSLRLETQPVPSRNWDSIRRRWDEDGRRSPDGLILVEELNENECEGDDMKEFGESGLLGHYSHSSNNSTNKNWGLLVQGRGAECSVCYILNTCRVLSSVGASTHFCLVRAKCFGDNADVQLRKAWLQ